MEAFTQFARGRAYGAGARTHPHTETRFQSQRITDPRPCAPSHAGYSYLFDSQINNSNAFATSGFTSLVRAGPSAFVLIYQKYFSPSSWPPFPQATFMARVSFAG